MKRQDPAEEDRRPSATFRVGAIALVFLIIGYQLALFVYKVSVTAVVAHRDRPDTVYVVDPALASRLLAGNQAAGDRLKEDGRVDSVSEPVSIRRDAPHSPGAQSVGRRFTPRRYESFPFNPNTVSGEELCRLGFSEKQAQAILHYREKGGRFRRKEDFARSFVVAFDALPGIGPFYAGRMVSYRKELGGYSYPEQLMDIWKFDREKYDALADLIVVSKPYRYPLWTLPEDSLKRHPYIRSYAAHGIVLFRSASPQNDWTVENLVKAGILKPDQGAKLAPCVASPQ